MDIKAWAASRKGKTPAPALTSKTAKAPSRGKDELAAARGQQVRSNAQQGRALELAVKRIFAWQTCKLERNHSGVLWRKGQPVSAGPKGRLDWTIWMEEGHTLDFDTKRVNKAGDYFTFDERCRPTGPRGGKEGHQHVHGRQIATLGGKAALLIARVINPTREDLYLVPFAKDGLRPCNGQAVARVAWDDLAPWCRPHLQRAEFVPLEILRDWKGFCEKGWEVMELNDIGSSTSA